MNTEHQSGFTFLEILISMTIVSLVALISTVNLIGFFSRQGLQQESKEMVALLRSAQEKSMNQENGSRWGVSFYNGPERDEYALFEVDEGLFASSTASVPGTVSQLHTISRRFTFTTNPALDTRINVAFSKISGLPSSAQTFYLIIGTDETSSSTITIGGNGLINYE
ncbi:MAG: prepilin-type N-terminal cleavage/methylation domain-containing protein [Candidatus Harrisonbacteria bacterium]|nr:prepilin-type N-terminal cleavage/methylation domain-containing protein [Candidatus Harrisonbacteria bacterium]